MTILMFAIAVLITLASAGTIVAVALVVLEIVREMRKD